MKYADPRVRFVSLEYDFVCLRDENGAVLGSTVLQPEPVIVADQVCGQGFEVSTWRTYSGGLWAHARPARWRGDHAWS